GWACPAIRPTDGSGSSAGHHRCLASTAVYRPARTSRAYLIPERFIMPVSRTSLPTPRRPRHLLRTFTALVGATAGFGLLASTSLSVQAAPAESKSLSDMYTGHVQVV